jgi:hypothetical protein
MKVRKTGMRTLVNRDGSPKDLSSAVIFQEEEKRWPEVMSCHQNGTARAELTEGGTKLSPDVSLSVQDLEQHKKPLKMAALWVLEPCSLKFPRSGIGDSKHLGNVDTFFIYKHINLSIIHK